jgi:PEP-CTERM motif
MYHVFIKMKMETKMNQNVKKLFLAVAASSFALSAHATEVLGQSSAMFDNPLPIDTVYSGVGTDTFTWGNSLSGINHLHFSGSNFSASTNTPFKLGSFSYTNGTTISGSNPTSIDFTAFMNFSQPAIPVVAAKFRLGLNGTLNSQDPINSSDFVNFNQTTSSSQFVIDGVAYTVQISGFRHVTGDGFLSAGGREFHVKEGGTANVDLYALVTTTPVPEPETWGMMLAGLGIVSLLSRRRKATAVH